MWHTTRKYSKEFAQVLANKKIKVITATRDIISQNLSLLFELMDLMYWDCDEYWKDGGDVDALFAKWIKDLREYEGGNRKTNDLFQTYKDYTLFTCSIQSFFENEFKDLCGVNLYEYEFDKRKGYSIIRKDNVEVFVYQIEKLNQISNELLDFLNIESGELVNGNQASSKWYSGYYKEAVDNIKISDSYYKECYNSLYLQHFYNEEDIERFKKKWGQHI